MLFRAGTECHERAFYRPSSRKGIERDCVVRVQHVDGEEWPTGRYRANGRVSFTVCSQRPRSDWTDGRPAGVLYASLHICACLPHSYTRMRKTDGRYIVSHTNTKTTRTRVAQVPFCFLGFMGCEHVSVPVAIIPSLFFFFTLTFFSLIFPS